MKKILGLDIGIKTIGWAVIHEPETVNEKYHIAGMGVRVVPLGTDETEEFMKGQPVTKNTHRIVMRSARRTLHRYKLRRQQLMTALGSLNMMPGEDLFELTPLELYRLRDRGVSCQLSLPELGRVLYHLNQKRGYQSNRKANIGALLPIETRNRTAGDNKESFLDLIDDRERALKDQNITIGQHFYRQLSARQNGEINRPVRLKDKVYLRSTYMEEFDRIWSTQQQFYPEVLTDENRKKIRNRIIYYQRPFRSKQGLINHCLFEKNHKVSHKSSPLYQRARIWQELNNLELISLQANKNQEEGFINRRRKLTQTEKIRLFGILNIKEKLSTKECLKVLGFTSGSDPYKLIIRYKGYVNGNGTYAQLKKIFDQYQFDENLLRFDVVSGRSVNFETGELLDKLQIDPAFERQPLFRLWHLVYSVEEPAVLINTLRNKFGFPVEMAEAIARIDFTAAGYGNLSARALRNILPYLEQGHSYAKSCELTGYKCSLSPNDADNSLPQLSEKLMHYPKNSLQQPVIERIFNQAVNLVNSVLDERNGYITENERIDKKFEIRFALARTLKQNAGERKRTYVDKLMQNRRNETIEAAIKGCFPDRTISRNDVIKYKLWEEFGHKSPYEPTTPVSLKQLLSSEYQIVHIIPRARLFDDSFHNKTICRRGLAVGVSGKSQMTTYDFMVSRGQEAFREYVAFVESNFRANNGISAAKFEKLMMSSDKIPDDFIHRQMQETGFISGKAKELFSKVCLTVGMTSSDVTNYLRVHWGYEQLILALNWPKYQSLGRAVLEVNDAGEQIKRILDWSKYDDYRYHAVDAVVVAATKPAYMQHLNSLNRPETEQGFKPGAREFQKPTLAFQAPFSFEEVLKATAQVLISYKAGKRVVATSVNRIKKGSHAVAVVRQNIPRGPLHKDTVFGRIRQFESIRLSPQFDRIDDVVRPDVRSALLQHLQRCDHDPRQAFNRRNLAAFKALTGFDSVTVYQLESVVRYKLDVNFKAADAEYIVDKGVRAVVMEHLAIFGNNPKVAFSSDHPVWMNKDKGIQIKSVRCFTRYRDLQALHRNQQGEPVDFVLTRNNHHMAFYRNMEGKLFERTVSFWQAVKRKQLGLPIIVTNPSAVADMVLTMKIDDTELLARLPDPTWRFETSLQHNEMFVCGLSSEQLQKAIDSKDTSLISENLFRVQKMSRKATGDIEIWFRHHLDTKIDESKRSKDANKFVHVRRLRDLNVLKVDVSSLGKLILK